MKNEKIKMKNYGGVRPLAAQKLGLWCGRTPRLPGYGLYGVCLAL